jgi:predicted PurR-regulated permease PerM
MISVDRQFTHRMVQTVLTVALVALVLAALWVARSALMLIYVSAIIAMGFAPMVRVLQSRTPRGRRGVPRTLAILAIYIGIVALVMVVGLTVVPPLIDQAGELWTRAPQAFNDVQRFLMRHNLMTHRVSFQEAVQNAPAGSGGSAVNTVLLAIWGLVGGMFGVVTILILSFYLLLEAQSLFDYATRLVPAHNRERFITVSHRIVQKVSAWLSAQFILAGIMGTFTAMGLGLLGVPYFYVIALIAAVGETIPIVGPIVAGVVAVAIASTASAKLALVVGLGFLVLHQLEANILLPKVMERRVGVSPVAVIVALLIGNELWGLMGAILAIPSAAILSVIFDELTAHQAEA